MQQQAQMQGPILVTGVAGFVGFHVAQRLLADGWTVFGVDNLNDYYDPRLKKARLVLLSRKAGFRFESIDLASRVDTSELFARESFAYVVHLAAQAGVAHSLDHPAAYIDTNLVGFANVLEGCRHSGCRHLIYASSSSVYGANTRMPLRTSDNVDHPLSLYGATKKANELMAHAYAHLFKLSATGLRFFTVYGPWGRPDMAIWIFTEAILEGRPVRLFNHGRMRRDFTYIDDVVEALVRLIPLAPTESSQSKATPDPATSLAPWRIYNIGGGRPVELNRLVDIIEQTTGKRAKRELLPMRPIDVLETCADCTDLERAVGFAPRVPIKDGLRSFVEWFLEFRLGRVKLASGDEQRGS